MNNDSGLYGWLIDNVHYNEDTGDCTWLTSKWNRSHSKGHNIGDMFGYVSSGYISVDLISFGFGRHQVHRLIWLMKTGSMPSNTIDHINRISTDNRWCNLREATAAQQVMNRTIMKTNTSGHVGIRIQRYNKQQVPYYTATLGANDKTYYYSSYNIDDCIEWRANKVKEHHRDFGIILYKE